MANINAVLPAQSAAGADVTTIVDVFYPNDSQGSGVLGLYLTSMTAVTGVATNNVTASFRQVRAGAVVQVIGSLTFSAGVNLTAEVPKAVPITNATVFQTGDVVDILLHQNGTGLAVPAGVVGSVAVG